MFSFNLTKFFVCFALIFLLFTACGRRQKNESETLDSSALALETVKSDLPFISAEPEIFQAEIIVTAGGAARKTFVARRGAQRRFDYDFGAANQVTVLQNEKTYLIFPAGKIYAETSPANDFAAPDDWTNYLTTEWLNAKTGAAFEQIESADQNSSKYLVRLDGKEVSEILITIDETLRLPVRQEFYTVSGEQKILNFVFEIMNIKLEADENLFIVPPDFKQTAIEDLRKEIRKR